MIYIAIYNLHSTSQQFFYVSLCILYFITMIVFFFFNCLSFLCDYSLINFESVWFSCTFTKDSGCIKPKIGQYILRWYSVLYFIILIPIFIFIDFRSFQFLMIHCLIILLHRQQTLCIEKSKGASPFGSFIYYFIKLAVGWVRF